VFVPDSFEADQLLDLQCFWSPTRCSSPHCFRVYRQGRKT